MNTRTLYKFDNPFGAICSVLMLLVVCVFASSQLIGCATPEGRSVFGDVVSDAAEVATFVGLDLALDASYELQPYRAVLEDGISQAYDNYDSPSGIATSIGSTIAKTVATEALRALLRSSLRDALTGEGPGSTGSPPPDQAAFQNAIAEYL